MILKMNYHLTLLYAVFKNDNKHPAFLFKPINEIKPINL